jgi:hypothetical protein
MGNACQSIRYRLATEIFPSLLTPPELEAIRLELESQGAAKQIIKKQKDTGIWGANLLGIAPNKTSGIKDVGTIPQFLRLVEMGLGPDSRPLRMAGRVLYRLVSRDEDPKLLFEYAKYSTIEIGAEPWIREIVREAAASALARGGQGDDPRVRGAAHKILNQVSAFLRSEPAVQRERAGLVERLGSYLSKAAPKKAYSVSLGKKSLKPGFLLLGDPVHVSASGQPDDLPFALHWMELLARLGLLATSASSAKIWGRLTKELDGGVWHPRNLRTLPKSTSPWAYHMFPLESDSKKPESRQADVTFRMALIARLAGWDLTSF